MMIAWSLRLHPGMAQQISTAWVATEMPNTAPLTLWPVEEANFFLLCGIDWQRQNKSQSPTDEIATDLRQ
jgi:hypothetical protein